MISIFYIGMCLTTPDMYLIGMKAPRFQVTDIWQDNNKIVLLGRGGKRSVHPTNIVETFKQVPCGGKKK